MKNPLEGPPPPRSSLPSWEDASYEERFDVLRDVARMCGNRAELEEKLASFGFTDAEVMWTELPENVRVENSQGLTSRDGSPVHLRIGNEYFG